MLSELDDVYDVLVVNKVLVVFFKVYLFFKFLILWMFDLICRVE